MKHTKFFTVGLVIMLMLSVLVLSVSTVVAQTTLDTPSLEITNFYTTDPGADYMAADVEINGECIGQIGQGTGYFQWGLPTGDLHIVIRSYGFPSCNQQLPLLAEYHIPYVAGQYYTVFMYRNTAGNAAVSLFYNNVQSPIPAGKSRIMIRNGVGFRPNVTLAFRLPSSNKPYNVSVKSGAQVVVELPAGDWQISLTNPPSALYPSHYFSQDFPFSGGELWEVTVDGPWLGGPPDQFGFHIFDFRLIPPNN